MDFYFVSNKLGFVCISIFLQTIMDLCGFYGLLLLYGFLLFCASTLGFLCISIFCQKHMDFYGFYGLLQFYGFLWTSNVCSVFQFFAKNTWISMDSMDFFYFMDFYGLLLYAYHVWITCMHFYGFLFCAKHTWIYMYAYFFLNTYRFLWIQWTSFSNGLTFLYLFSWGQWLTWASEYPRPTIRALAWGLGPCSWCHFRT